MFIYNLAILDELEGRSFCGMTASVIVLSACNGHRAAFLSNSNGNLSGGKRHLLVRQLICQEVFITR